MAANQMTVMFLANRAASLPFLWPSRSFRCRNMPASAGDASDWDEGLHSAVRLIAARADGSGKAIGLSVGDRD